MGNEKREREGGDGTQQQRHKQKKARKHREDTNGVRVCVCVYLRVQTREPHEGQHRYHRRTLDLTPLAAQIHSKGPSAYSLHRCLYRYRRRRCTEKIQSMKNESVRVGDPPPFCSCVAFRFCLFHILLVIFFDRVCVCVWNFRCTSSSLPPSSAKDSSHVGREKAKNHMRVPLSANLMCRCTKRGRHTLVGPARRRIGHSQVRSPLHIP